MHRRHFIGATSAAALAPSFAPALASAAEPPIAGELKRLTEPGRDDNRATYMPDGQSILFASRRSGRSQIWTMQPDGSGARHLHKSSANDFGRVAPNPAGTRLCFGSDRSGQSAVHVLDLQGGAVTTLSDTAWWSFGPSWSARGLIAYFSRKGGNQINLWTVQPDGTQARQISNQPGESRQPWWSPDGATLAYSADQGTKAFQVWLAAPDNTGARALTAAGDWQQPFWSPDGRRLAVSAKVDGPRFRILVIDLASGQARPIQQPAEADNVHPAWSPDGRRIVFTSGAGESAALWLFSFA